MRNRTGPSSPGGDGGFTLVELVLAIFIIGIITIPLGNVVIGYLRSTDATTARLLESHDVQIVSAYWAQDVASIGTRDALGALKPSIDTPATTSTPECGVTGTIVSFKWDDFPDANAPATVITVAYVVAYVVTDGVGQCELQRVRSGSLASNITLAHDLDPSKPPTVACSTTCTGTTGPPPFPVPATATLTLTVKDPGNLGDPYVVLLTGHRRQS